ncbi:MAG: major facilitator superfamily domain-containing protein 6 [Thiohalomonadaceae bacterium]
MYWRLSTFYLFHFASLGVLVPYWSLYLKHQGFGAGEIGELMALLMATKIVSPNIWGWLADHTGLRLGVVRAGALLALLTFTAIFFVAGYWATALVMVAFSFFWNAVLPQFEANTLSHLGEQQHRYSSIRLWGSIGFIATVAGMGPLLDVFDAGIVPGVMLALFVGILLASLLAPALDGAPHAGNGESLRRVLRRPEVLALLAVCFLIQASHGPYYTFYTLYMEGHGYTRSAIGQLWALGVVAEVGIFLLMPRLVAHYGLRSLLLTSLALTTLRWLLIGHYPQSLPVVVGAQTLHAASFGIYHATAIALFHRYFPGRLQGRGQALYASLSFGAGGALGSYYSGAVWEWLGAEAAFIIAAGLSAAGLVIGWRWLKD